MNWSYLWNFRFFGLPASYRAELYEELFTLCYYGNGFTFREMYDLPVEKRRFLLKLLEKAKNSEKNQVDNANTGKDPKIPSHVKSMMSKVKTSSPKIPKK